MSATIPVTRADARLLHALASLASVQPDKARAGHLVGRAEDLARRIEGEVRKVDTNTEQRTVDG